MLTYAAALAATETAGIQSAASGSTQRDCASFVLNPDGRISNWNEPAEQMLGYSEEQALGRHFAWFFPVDEVQRGESERVLRIADENGFHQWQGAWLRKDHSRFRVDRATGGAQPLWNLKALYGDYPKSEPRRLVVPHIPG